MAHTERVNVPVVVDVRIMGRDGHLYPPRMPLPLPERQRLRAAEHDLHCRQGLAVRKVQAQLLAQGTRRSIGQVHNDLTQFECPLCANRPPPEPRPTRHPLGELAGAADALDVIRETTPEPEPPPPPREPLVAHLTPEEADTASWLAVIRDRAAGYSWEDLNEGTAARRKVIVAEILEGI